MNYYAKIMLFGEYSVLTGTSAVTIPYKKYCANLSFPTVQNVDSAIKKSNSVLKDFYRYLVAKKWDSELTLNFDQFNQDIKLGMYLESSIPQNFGLGSSGALVAAVFNKYALINLVKTNLSQLKKTLAQAESFFHGSSSGIDPLSCLLGEPLLFKNNSITPLKAEMIKESVSHFFLYNTHLKSSTGNFVQQFLNNLSGNKNLSVYKSYCRLIDASTEKLIEGDTEALWQNLSEISGFQFKYFKPMIPEEVRPIWLKGLKSGEYYFKLYSLL